LLQEILGEGDFDLERDRGHLEPKNLKEPAASNQNSARVKRKDLPELEQLSFQANFEVRGNESKKLIYTTNTLIPSHRKNR